MTDPVQFSDPNVQAAAPPSEQPASDGAGQPNRPGRPRSQETLARDEAVAALLAERGPLTREDVAAELNLKSTHAYLSLWRLKRDGRVERGTNGEVRHAWRLVPTA